jgi:isochorismate pyruvate lyase
LFDFFDITGLENYNKAQYERRRDRMDKKRMAEIRLQIDLLDEKIVELLGKRRFFVGEAAKYKKNKAEVSAPDRVEEVIDKVKKIAEKHGIETSIVEQVYRTMINCFIQKEGEIHQSIFLQGDEETPILVKSNKSR